MARYISIRGWLECDQADIPKLKKATDDFSKGWSDLSMTQEIRHLYQKGWRFPEIELNWTAYIFYGADIKSYYLDYIREQIENIIKIDKEIEGVFHIDDEDGERKLIWKIDNGKISEENRDD